MTRLPFHRVLAFAAPGIPLALFAAPFPALVTTFYSQHTSVTAAAIATILLLTRVSDAFVDLSIGVASDRTRSRFGPRKPWLLLGALLGIATLLVTFRPPADAGTGYFAVAIILYFLAMGTLDIPLRAWAGELASDTNDRNRLSAWITFTLLLGGAALLALPDALKALGLVATTRIDATMMGIYSTVGLILLPIAYAIVLFGLPNESRVVSAERPSVAAMLKALPDNKPLRVMLCADAATQIAWGMTYALLFIAFDRYYGFGESIALLLLAATFAQILAIPLCARLADRYGRHRVWGFASIGSLLLAPVLYLMPPGGATPIWFVFLFISVSSALGTPNMMFPMALVNDIADYDCLRSGQARGATYYAGRMLSYKLFFALGNAGGFALLAMVGFDPKSDINTPLAIEGLLAGLIWIPAVLFGIAGFFLLRFPLNARRQDTIRRALSRQQRRSAATWSAMQRQTS